MSEGKCPIWGEDAEISVGVGSRKEVHSPRAGGAYVVTLTAENLLKESTSTEKKRLLTCWLIEQRRLGVDCPEIGSNTLDFVMQARPWSVQERADYLLRYLKRESTFLGRVFTFFKQSPNLYPTMKSDPTRALVLELFANSASERVEELVTLSEFCRELKWLRLVENRSIGSSHNPAYEIMLSPQGYMRVEEIEGTNSGSTEAFIAMWFNPAMDEAEAAIKAGIRNAGYTPVRIDNKEHNKKIDDEIVASIRRCRFLVADFTQTEEKGARGGVYYEAGFAHGLNLPVIFTCREGSLKYVHFDTRQYNHIEWSSGDELRIRLAQRISATIGDGPLKKPT